MYRNYAGLFYLTMAMTDPIDDYLKNRQSEEKATVLRRCLQLLEYSDELKGLFTFNEMTLTVEFLIAPPWDASIKPQTEIDDINVSMLQTFLTRRHNFSPMQNNLLTSILDVARLKKYHPLKDHINKTAWDGTKRLDLWLHTVCGVEDNIYTQAVARKCIVAAIARLYKPGIKFDYLTILEGRQAARKSMLIERMAILPKYFTTISFSQSDKEITENISGKWMIEVAEMHGFRKQEVERTKALLSRATDRCRLAYGRLAKDYPRTNILIGTLNPDGENKYLADRTANRRYWPVVCSEKININLFDEIRDQLYAEAMIEFNKGENLWLDNDQIEAKAVEQQNLRQTVDPWDMIVADWLDLQKLQMIDVAVSVLTVTTKALNVPAERMNNMSHARVSRAIIKAGWIRNEEKNLYYPPGKHIETVKDDKPEW